MAKTPAFTLAQANALKADIGRLFAHYGIALDRVSDGQLDEIIERYGVEGER